MIVRALAPAKINLGLEILGRRDDGFHEIRTIIAAISLFDRLQVVAADQPTLDIDRPDLAADDNLVLRAVELIRARHPNVTPSIAIRKRIPVAAGLGGASSDAAATLIACDLCYRLETPATMHIAEAATLGSDVPFFLTGGLAMASGRGEVLTQLPDRLTLCVVIVAPHVTVPSKTPTLYSLLRHVDFSDGSRVHALSEHVFDWSNLDLLQNAFKRPLYELEPSLRSIPSMMQRLGATVVGLSGAGPAHYALEIDPERARRLASRIRTELDGAANVHTARLIPHGIMSSVRSGEE